MKISVNGKEYCRKDIKSIYPCAIVDYEGGENTPISLEWLEQNREKVKIRSFALLVLFRNSSQKEEIRFDTYEEMLKTLNELYEKLKKIP